MRRDSVRSFLLALVVLVASIAAELQIAFVHDDDGCVVEIHCLACRLVLGCGGAAPTITVTVAPAVLPVGFVLPLTVSATPGPVLDPRPSRGPPVPTPPPTTV